MTTRNKTVTIKVSVPDDWTEARATEYFTAKLDGDVKRAAYNATRNAEFKEFRAMKAAGKLPSGAK